MSEGAPIDDAGVRALMLLSRRAMHIARKAVMNPAGGTDSAKRFAVARADAQIADLKRQMKIIGARAASVVDNNLRRSIERGARSAERTSVRAGFPASESPISAALVGAETGRAAVLLRQRAIRDTTKAFDSIATVSGRAIRESRALGLNTETLRRILAGGAIAGEPAAGVQRVRKMVGTIVNKNGMVEVANRRTGAIITFKPDVYTDLVYQTSMAEAHVIGEIDRLTAKGIDLVKIIGSNSVHFCTAFVGHVYSLSGTSTIYPAFSRLRGGPPFHPRCTKRIVPFNERLASPAEREKAKPTAETEALHDKPPSQAQQTYQDREPTKPAAAPKPPAVAPPAPTSTTQTDIAASVERVDRSGIVQPAIRRIVDDALADVARIGRDLPRAVRPMSPGTALSTRPPVVFGVARPTTVWVNPRCPYWPKAQQIAVAKFGAKEWSTPRAGHPILAAVGRQQLAAAVGAARYAEINATSILRVATIADRTLIGEQISASATRSPAAFVAEVFAMLAAELIVPPEILLTYARLGGQI